MPLLRTVEPAKLAVTVNALASTLDGRGVQVGRTVVVLDRYLRGLNPSVPVLQGDISLRCASAYAVAAPDLCGGCGVGDHDATVVSKRDVVAGFLAGRRWANTATAFLSANEGRIIRVGRVGRLDVGGVVAVRAGVPASPRA